MSKLRTVLTFFGGMLTTVGVYENSIALVFVPGIIVGFVCAAVEAIKKESK